MATRDDGSALSCGLHRDLRDEAGPGSTTLLRLANEPDEMQSICACGRKASMNPQSGGDGWSVLQGEQVWVGGNEHHRAVSPSCLRAKDGSDPARMPG